MLNLKRIADIPAKRPFSLQERKDMQKTDFQPDELKQLKEMEEKELKLLLIFCGIRAYEGIPLEVMEEDEMRMAYVIWRAESFNEKRHKRSKWIERGLAWYELAQNTISMKS